MTKAPRAANRTAADAYLRALQEYAGSVRIPGLDTSSTPISLDQIFIEPRLIATAAIHTSENGEPPLASARLPEVASAILAREQSLVLLGEPGQGKSTLLYRYASKLASNADTGKLPLLVELGRKPDRTHMALRADA
jgi:hypothetical protein